MSSVGEELVERGLDFIRKLDEYAGLKRRLVLVKHKVTTNPAYGKVPSERTLNEKLRLGIINLDKPPGPTSHEVVAWIKKMLGLTKAGHGGTLVPR